MLTEWLVLIITILAFIICSYFTRHIWKDIKFHESKDPHFEDSAHLFALVFPAFGSIGSLILIVVLTIVLIKGGGI